MSKRTIFFSLTLVFLLFGGCTYDRYASERRYWQLRKQAQAILNNPFRVAPAQLQKTIQKLQEFAAMHPQSKQSSNAEFYTARLYIATGSYDKARQLLEKMTHTYSSVPAVCAEAEFLNSSFIKEAHRLLKDPKAP